MVRSSEVEKGKVANDSSSMACCRELKLADGRNAAPQLVGGPLTTNAAAFSASGTRLFTPCGTTAFCYSARTTQLIGTLADHRGQVTALCSGALRPGEGEPIATGTSAGEIRIWDAKTLAPLASLEVDGPVAALRWPERNTLLVFTGLPGRPAQVVKVEIQKLTAPGLANNAQLPICSQRLGAIDAFEDIIAMADGEELIVWRESWQRSRSYSHRNPLTAITIDPQRRYIASGDDQGVVWSWWGICEEDANQSSIVPGRWHWHHKQVRCLTHCGPLMLSGGEEGVLSIRRADDDTASFVPRLGSAVLHITSTAGGKSCLSMADNSLALVDSLHGYTKPRWIRAVELPAPLRRKLKKQQRRRRALPAVLHQLPARGMVVSCSGRRVHLFSEDLGELPPRTLGLNNSNIAAPRGGEDGQRWTLRLVTFSSDAEAVLTWETRASPAMERFDQEAAETSVVKWWSRGGPSGPDEYSVDTISYTAHTAAVTVALALPQRGGLFVTASLDGFFKCWEALPVATETGSSFCWQSIASGSWRSRPIQCGCASVDGSVLALGLEGAVALFAPETGTELGILPLLGKSGEGGGQAAQLHCAVASERLLLLASVHGSGAAQEEIICWDLASLTVIARVSLQGKLPGSGESVLRVCEAQHAGADLRLLAFRTASELDDKIDAQAAQICMWRWSWSQGAGIEGFTSQVEIEASLPKDIEVLDASFVGGGPTQQVVCWTSSQELWALDFAREGKQPLRSGEERPDPTLAGTPMARVLGDRTTTSVASAPQLLQLPLRTTPAQQAGLTSHLMQRVIPANAPSHHLPPPALIWAGVLATWGKTLESHDASASPETYDAAAMTAEALTHSEANDVPSWARRGPLASETCRAELADADWVEQMIKEAFPQSC